MSNGLKYDEGKRRWDLLPLSLIEQIVDVYTFGATKYEPNTWQKIEDGYNRYKAAMFRHLVAHEKGETIDPESGLPHLAHMAWNALALLHFNKERTMKQEKINVSELLKDCPKGMELYSPIYGLGILTKVTDRIHVKFPNEHNVKCFRPDGKVSEDGEIMIYPKGKTTWEGFVPPCKFKDGDILYAVDEGNEYIFILKHIFEEGRVYCYLSLKGDDLRIQEVWLTDYNTTHRLATEEEKQKLLDAIKENGYRWDAETKNLEELPKFKVGDKVRHKNNPNICFTITNIEEDSYDCGAETAFWISDQDNYELVPNKFDITTLKPFDKVLVRDSDTFMWSVSLFSHIWNKKFFCVGAWYNQCIPYEGNEHLLSIMGDCDNFYKTWEE